MKPRNLFQSPDAENRHIRLVGRQVTLSRTPSQMAAWLPEMSEQTDEVLDEVRLQRGGDRGAKAAKVV